MHEEIELLGEWWLPYAPEDKVNGIIKYSQDTDITLELIGSFGSFKDALTLDERRHQVIQGFTTRGKKVTLVDCLQLTFNMNMPGILTEKYSVSVALMGCYFDKEEDISFTSIRASYENLESWLSPPSYEIKFNQTEKKTIVEYSLPESVMGRMSEYIVSIKYTSRNHGNLFNQFTIEQTGWVIFEKDKHTLDFLEAKHLIDNFSNLLTLCSSVYINSLVIKASTEEDKNIELIFKRGHKKNKKQLSRHDFIFTFSDVQDDFQGFLNIWNDKYEKLKPVVHYFVDAHKKEVYSPVSFLKLVQALESFSRRLRQNWVEDQELHSKRVEDIISSINNVDNQEWLRNVLKFVNEPSLITRMKGLFRETNFLFNLSSSKISSLVYKIVETRNYYTHFDESKKDKILNIHQMFYLGQLFIIMLRSLILLELGFTPEFITKNIDQHGRIKDIKQDLGM